MTLAARIAFATMLALFASACATAPAPVTQLVPAEVRAAPPPVVPVSTPAPLPKQIIKTVYANDEQELRRVAVASSIETYFRSSKACPCPYSVQSNGARCGKKSAYCRGGGQAPVCYTEDVSAEMLTRLRANEPIRQPDVHPVSMHDREC